MGIYKDGELERYTFIDVFYNAETKRLESPLNWWQIWMEIMEDVDPPMGVYKFTWFIEDYRRWIRRPRGVTSNYNAPKKTYILHSVSEEEDFDYDGAGDCYHYEDNYEEFDTEEDALKYLKKNIYGEDRLPSKLDTVEEFCQQYGFKFYERKYG